MKQKLKNYNYPIFSKVFPMKPTVWLGVLVFAIVMVSCSTDDSSGDSAMDQMSVTDKIAMLKGEKADLEAQIAELEAQLPPDTNRRLVPITVSEVQTGTLRHFVDVQGTVESDNNVLVSPQRQGVVTKVLVDEGQRVSEGQVLAQMDDSALQLQLQELETQLGFAQTLFEKQQRVYDKNVGSEIQFLEAKTNLETLQRRKKTIEKEIDYMRIRAPFAGVVDQVIIKVGEAASPGRGIARVVNPSNLQVKSMISEKFIGKLDRGDDVELVFPNSGDTLRRKITSVGQSIDPVNRTFDVFVSIPTTNKIRPNMLCVARYNDITKEDIVTVPLNAIQDDNNGQFVYVVSLDEEGQEIAVKRRVETGLSYRDTIEIIEGVQAGDKLVTTGFQFLSENAAVQVM